jgi:hypothetical protein
MEVEAAAKGHRRRKTLEPHLCYERIGFGPALMKS